MKISELVKADDKEIAVEPDDILCFVAVRNEMLRIDHFVDYYRKFGVNKFFFADNDSSDGTKEYLDAQDDCYRYNTEGAYFVENISPPAWTNTLANVFGDGHWCLTVDADELLVFPHSEHVDLRQFCAYLESCGDEALYCAMIDMYPDGPVTAANYAPGSPFIESCRYFDPEPGWIWPRDGECPQDQMFGGVRERVFWKGEKRNETPPCLNKIPLIKWRKGMKYLVSMHFHSGARLSAVTGNLLHFKFLEGFVETSKAQVKANTGVVEKSLQERAAYLDEIDQNPHIVFRNEQSVFYEGTDQLVRLGWMRTSDKYEEHANALSATKKLTRSQSGNEPQDTDASADRYK
ncbi:MAG: glycosyltransferase family 2 protein [Rhizobiaceae bacterium]